MFRHIVFFKFRTHINQEIISDLLQELEKEKETIPEIIAMSWGKTVNPAETKGYTHAVIMDFTDKSAYESHVSHPQHQIVQKKLIPLLDGKLENAVLRFDYTD